MMPDTTTVRIGIASIVIIILLLAHAAWQFLVVMSIGYSCGDFILHEDAVRSYENGNSGLDGDGDGIPCENLLRKMQ